MGVESRCAHIPASMRASGCAICMSLRHMLRESSKTAAITL